MNDHILGLLGQSIEKGSYPKTFYDFATQMSYFDQQYTDKVISHFSSVSTIETRTIETSDADSFSMRSPNTVVTETIEQSDAEQLRLSCLGTVETSQIETSDSDGFYMRATGTKETFTVETSDSDGYFNNSTVLLRFSAIAPIINNA